MGRKNFLHEPEKYYGVDIFEFVHTKPWKDKSFLLQKYVVEGRSIDQIAKETLSSKAVVRKYLIGFKIKLRVRGKPGLRPAQIPYGYRRSNGLMVPHEGELKVVSVIEKMHRKGTSLREICDYLSEVGVPT